MKGSATHLMELLEGSRKRFIIPVYQRNYDWKKDNCKQLFDDLVQLVKQNKGSHFFGSIVSYSHGRNEIVLIDGQQRITTISLILIAMVNIMKNGLMTAEDAYLCKHIEEDFLVEKYSQEKRKVRLKPFRDDCEAFDRLIFKDEEDYINDSKVTINYRYFYNRILNNRELTMDELFTAIDNLIIIDIELEPEHGDNPQLIFESLNSTGLDLTESDKIRNFILMGLAPVVQEKYYDNYWNKIEKHTQGELDSFVRDYLTILTGSIPTIKGVYPAFKDYTRNNSNDLEDILKEMLRYANAYKKIKTYTIGSTTANDTAERLAYLEMTVANPFLMVFLTYAEDNNLEMSEIETVLACVETFIFRRLMCDLPTNALNKIFATLHKSVLKQKKDTDTYSSVMIYQLEDKKLSSAFPKDNDFIQGFTSKNIYSMRAKNKAYIFERLENGSSKEKNDVIKNIENGILTYEHIMPQTLSQAWRDALGSDSDRIQEQWLHTISNLTLTGYNSKYSNRSFDEKKTMTNGFNKSGIRLNHYIAQFEKWTEDELMLRKAELEKMALEIWQYPITSFVPEKKEEELVYLSEDNGTCTGRMISAFYFQDVKYPASDWAEMLWQVGNLLYAINPAIMYAEASNTGNVWVETTEVSKKYKKIADHLYFCPSNSNTWNKMSLLKRLFEKYSIDEDDLSFALIPQKETEEPSDLSYNGENRYWLIPSNDNKFHFSEWIKTHDYVFWRHSVNFKEGDTVYFYSTAPTSAVFAAFFVESINHSTYDTLEEIEYWADPTALTTVPLYAKLKLIATTDNSDKLTKDILFQHGLNGAPQKGMVLKGELLEYIQEVF
ncbi:MAG: DUF262 domain-containing protein [Bacteroidales bacterium]|nr:DUF262 domain-containing protein [Bacteroidales bacterium]